MGSIVFGATAYTQSARRGRGNISSNTVVSIQ